MSSLKLVGLSGNITTPSKTRALIETAVTLAADRLSAEAEVIEVGDFGDQLGRARRLTDLDAAGQGLVARIVEADALIVATPIYKASYPGLFKHLIDLLDPLSLVGKPILIAATGGGEKHALAVEHQLRPLFAFFEAHSLPTAVHVSDKDFTDGALTAPAALTRLARAVAQFDLHFPQVLRPAQAAE
ncbi:MAG: NAD(P)H-dependent oxidoreductase [Pseudomonadota bacterium]